MSAAHRAIGDRGATLTEYAMGVALVAVVSIGALSWLERNSGDQLEERAATSGAGAELSGQGFSYGGGGGGGATGGTDGAPDPDTIVIDGVSLPATKAGSRQSKHVWIANVTLGVSAAGEDYEGALAEVTFVVGTTSTTVSCPLPSDRKGEIECELAGISGAHATVTMVVERIYGANIDYTSPTPKPTTVFSRPSSVSPP